MLSYQPQGRCTLRCSACSVRLLLAERGHDLLHVLAALAVRHQHRIGGLDHDHVVEPDDGDEPAGGMHMGVAARRAAGRRRRRSCRRRPSRPDLPDGVPGAEVVPAGVQRHDPQVEAAAGAALHHRVVHRFRQARRRTPACPGGRTGRRCVRPSQAVRTAARMSGRKLLERGQPDRGAQHEDAAVPVVAAFGQIARGRCRHRASRRSARPAAAPPAGGLGQHVAVAGLGPVGRDAEDADRALGGDADRRGDRAAEGGAVGHGLVGRHDHQHRVVAVPACSAARVIAGAVLRPTGSSSSVAGEGSAELAQLLLDQEAMLVVADHHRRREREAGVGEALQARDRGLEQRLLAAQGQELLRESRPATAAKGGCRRRRP